MAFVPFSGAPVRYEGHPNWDAAFRQIARQNGKGERHVDQQNREDNSLEDAAARMSKDLSGTTVEVEQSSKSRVEGGQVHMVDSAAKNVSASALHMEDSAAGMVRSGSVDVNDGAIGVAIATEIRLQDSTALLTVGKTVHAENVHTLMVLAPRVSGRVESVFTPATAFAAGAGMALGLVVMARTLAWLVSRPLRRLNRETESASS